MPIRIPASQLTAERLRQVLRYEPETGHLYWLEDRGPWAKAGHLAGVIRPDGYVMIRLFQTLYYAHRLAWFWMTGEWPNQIDHKDLDKANNSWDNIRISTQAQNVCNTRLRKDNTSGFKGVVERPSRKNVRYIAQYRQKHIGCFATAEQAHEAWRKEATRQQGEFVRSR